MTKREMFQLLTDYDTALEESVRANKALGEIQVEARKFVLGVHRIAPSPYGDIYERLRGALRALPKESREKDEALAIDGRLKKATAEANARNAKVADVLSILEPLVLDLNSQAVSEVFDRRNAMIGEVISFLTPYCDNPVKAREMALQCDKIAALEFEVRQMQTIHDFKGRAHRLIAKTD